MRAAAERRECAGAGASVCVRPCVRVCVSVLVRQNTCEPVRVSVHQSTCDCVCLCVRVRVREYVCISEYG